MKKGQCIVDLGTNNITFVSDMGVFREPNIAIISRFPKFSLVAAGKEAQKAMVKLKSDETVIYPVVDGAVINVEVMALMLRHFFSLYAPPRLFQQMEIYVPVSCGLSILERESIEAAVVKAGYKDVTLFESLTTLLPYLPQLPVAVLIIGSGNTEIGVLDKNGIITGCSINIAGNLINNKIKEQLLEQQNFMISWSMAEEIKNTIGSLHENDYSGMEIIGKDMLENKMKKIDISASNIRTSIHFCFKKIAEIIESVLTTLPSNVLDEVTQNGLYIAGGGSKINGLTNFFSNYLKLPIFIVDNPEYAQVFGLSKMLNEPKYRKFFANTR